MNAPTHIILVAEDEPLTRMLAVEVLEDAGYEVVETEHAQAALDELHARGGEVLLLFTDIHMPGVMNGLQLAHHVSGLWPDIALLIASAAIRPSEAEMPDGCHFLAKPYDPNHVVAHARKVADSASQRRD